MDADPYGNSWTINMNINVEESTFLSQNNCSSTAEGGVNYGNGFRTY